MFKKLGYTIIVRKETGILIASKTKHKFIECTTTTHQNIITARFHIRNTILRIIAAYGLQESCSADDRTDFFDELNIEIQSCITHNETPIIAGDLNGKIECVSNIINPLSPNGKLLNNIIASNSLKVLNFHPECTGKWTRVLSTNQKL